jgi:hypothetical protein
VALCVKDRHLSEAGSASRIQRWLKPRWWHRYGVATVTGLAAVSIRRLLEKQGSFEVTTADGYDIGEALRRHPGRQNPCATDIDRFLPFFCCCGGILPASDRLDGVCVHSAPPNFLCGRPVVVVCNHTTYLDGAPTLPLGWG